MPLQKNNNDNKLNISSLIEHAKSQYALYSTMFSPFDIINKGQHDQYLCHHLANTKYSVCIPTINKCECRCHYTSFSGNSNTWSNLPSKDNTEAMVCVPQIVTYAVEEKWIQKDTKVARWWKLVAYADGEKVQKQMLFSEEIWSVALSVIKLCLSKGIS